MVVGITGCERHKDGIGTFLTDVTDITAQIVAIGINSIVYLFTQIITHHHRILCHTIDHTTGTFLVEKVGMVVMSDGDDYPVSWLQCLTNGWPQICIKRTGGHASECLVLNRDFAPIKIFVGEEAPSPLAIVSIAHRTVAHGGVANKEEHGIRTLTSGARSRTIHQRLRDRVRGIVDDFLLSHRRRQVIKRLRHRSKK